MIVTINTPINAIAYTETIFIDKDVSLDANFLEQLMQTFPESKFVVQTYDLELHSSLNSSVLYSHDELETLVKNTELARQKYKKEITFDDGFSVEQAIDASRKINDWADLINGSSVNGEPLSPLEKYTLAYSLVSNRLYTKSQSTQGSRNVISVLTGDEIVCAGFASALAALCTKIGVPCTYRGCIVQDKTGTENHANCLVRIEDTKYNVHGVFNADPTWDCVPEEYRELLKNSFNFNFKHFLITNKDYKQIYPNVILDYFFRYDENNKISYHKIKIPNIEALYPEKEINIFKNPTIFNEESHEINIAEIKRQAIERMLESFPIKDNPRRRYIPDLKEELFIDQIVSFILEETLNTPPTEKTDIIDFVERHYRYLNSNFSVAEIKEKLAQKINDLPDEQILAAYFYMVNSNLKKNHYSMYMSDLFTDRLDATPLTKTTLAKLFKNILPLLVGSTEEMDNAIIEEMVSTLTPLALNPQGQQKSQE